MNSQWIVYSRPGCGLCEEFLTALAELLGERAAIVEVVDIDTDETLLRKYFDRIPVLTVDGDFVCQYRLDVERVRRYLER
jgi:glutaredoxin